MAKKKPARRVVKVPPKIKIDTLINKELGEIKQTTKMDDQIMEAIISVRNHQTREALKQLGWVPPEEAAALRQGAPAEEKPAFRFQNKHTGALMEIRAASLAEAQASFMETNGWLLTD